jgi:cysteine desulfurase family protein (TIGR01976 family)
MSRMDVAGRAAPNVERVRRHFPALAGDTAFLENAGGSQVPDFVMDRMRAFMEGRFVQTGASYRLSQEAAADFAQAHAFAETFVGASEPNSVALGPSTSQMLRMLADCLLESFNPGDEIVVAESGHEANIGPWVRLERFGLRVRFWELNQDSWRCELSDLEALLGPRTRIVALPHVSNLIGAVEDVREVVELAHSAGARVVVDGVAFAPHRAIAVGSWGVDWYALSWYKVFGPHIATLYGRPDAWATLTGPNHFFVPRSSFPYKFELGCQSYEACAGLLGVGEYLRFLSALGTDEVPTFEPAIAPSRSEIESAFEAIAELERRPTERLLGYLRDQAGVTLCGPTQAGAGRVGTVSFVSSRVPNAAIVAATDAANIGIRSGHMYAYRLCEALGLDPQEGVVRISLAHYNTLEEVDRLISILDTVL